MSKHSVTSPKPRRNPRPAGLPVPVGTLGDTNVTKSPRPRTVVGAVSSAALSDSGLHSYRLLPPPRRGAMTAPVRHQSRRPAGRGLSSSVAQFRLPQPRRRLPPRVPARHPPLPLTAPPPGHPAHRSLSPARRGGRSGPPRSLPGCPPSRSC